MSGHCHGNGCQCNAGVMGGAHIKESKILTMNVGCASHDCSHHKHKELSEQRTRVLRCSDRKSDKRAHCICDCALINHNSANPTGLTLNPENENYVNTPMLLAKATVVEFLLVALFIILEMSRSHTYLVPFII